MFNSEYPFAALDDTVEPKIHFHTAHQGKHSFWHRTDLGVFFSTHWMVLPSHPQMFQMVWNCEASGGLTQRVKHVVFMRFCHVATSTDHTILQEKKAQLNKIGFLGCFLCVQKNNQILIGRQMYSTCSRFSRRCQWVCYWCWINSKTQRKLNHREGYSNVCLLLIANEMKTTKSS